MKDMKDQNTAGREFSRKISNSLYELQLQTGIHQRIESLISDFADEHPNLRASYFSREVDEAYFPSTEYSPEVLARPSMQALAVEGNQLYEFILFAQGFRRDIVELNSIMHIQEIWLEPDPARPFLLRVSLFHNFSARTILLASTGEGQDAIQEFIARLRYLRGW
jgi:hypothetical protein